MAGGQQVEAPHEALCLLLLPLFLSGGAMLGGIESWAGWIKSSIHHTHDRASASGQALINTVSFIRLLVLSMNSGYW